MARSFKEIHTITLNSITADDILTMLNITSTSGIWYRVSVVIALCIYGFELILDTHKQEINTLILEQKTGKANWYKNLCLSFQFGFDLIVDSDKFDNTGFTVEQIEASKIIKYCSVKRSLESSRLIIKVAAENGDNLIQLTTQELESFKLFLEETSYEGDHLIIINNPADKLILEILIYRDPLVLGINGNSILNGGKPVEVAIRQYLKELKFNGEFVVNDLIEKIRTVDGVNNAHIVSANSSSYDVITSSFSPFTSINVRTIPKSGYFQLVTFDNVSYVV
ncbi:conserved hypothetical protein [Flavobacterium psychrophilum]|uniref:hypothetical protein n=1 Tax=Flavobacterium psychrophilum TaxID=96345 RepID=UPI000B7C3BC4|nr:hypothetical protein [Flavobacterium psychrophilum]SNB26478.1 conserved hypothetical protein [Flavobacterium psychrophilum]